MRKAFIILLCVLAVFAIVSCKNEPKPEPEPAKPETFEVSFDSQFGSEVATATVEKGTKVAKPQDPTKEDFIFGGWFKDATYETEYNFNDAVTEATTLYAKWTSEDPGVAMKTYKLTAGTNESADKNDRFQLRFKASGDNAFLTDFKAGDVVSYQFKSTPVEGSVAVTRLRVRGASAYGATSDFSSGIVLSEPDTDGWITVTCTFAEGMDFTETGLLMDFRKAEGKITAGDVLEIRDMKFNDQEITWVDGNTSAGLYEGCAPTLEIINPFFKYKLTATKGTDGVDGHKYDQDKFRLIWNPNVKVKPGDVVTVMFKAERKDELTAGRAFTYSIRDVKKWFSEMGKGSEYPQFWSVYDDTASDGWIVASYVFPSADAATKETIDYGEEGATFVIDFRDTKIASPAEGRIADVLYVRSITLKQGETTTELVLDKETVATKYAAPTVEEF